jgi:hypothetical protein
MRVLHVGLDYFVEPRSTWAPAGAARLSGDHYRPWRADAVRGFLADRFGLDPARPVPGRVVREHEGPLACWREWVEAGGLVPPFDLVHLDAHTCLGAGDAGWYRILGRLAHLPLEKRVEAAPPGLTPENYLLFAAAYGWLASITLVAHPEWRPDVLPILHRDGDPATGELEIRAYDPHLLERAFEDPGMASLPDPVSRDPAVPFRAVPGEQYRDEGGFDRIVVSAPEKYTPPQADALIPVLGGYVAGT